MSLLQKAKGVTARTRCGTRIKYDPKELLELAIAYANGEVNGPQVKAALSLEGGSYKTNIQTLMANTILSAIRRKEIRVEVLR